MADNKSLGAAKKAKQDEFYTRLVDIENEMKHYRKHFKDKVVLCNCDDPYESNFFKYFALNFNYLGLKKLIATCYVDSPIAGDQMTLFDLGTKEEITKKPHKIVITEVDDMNGDGAFDMADIEWLLKNDSNVLTELEGNGDFRSPECIELLEEADIVVTNPPFSLFRDYVATLMEHKKKFLIIGTMNAIHYKEIFPLLKNNELWTGYKSFGGGMNMIVPDKVFDPDQVKNYKVNENGEKIVNVMGVIWFTNLDIQKRHEWLDLFKPYNPNAYNQYDNIDGIDVETLADIPCDYPGVMGVPDTIMSVYNPEQFELLGIGSGNLAKEAGVTKNYRGRTDVAFTLPDGTHKCPYSRILIRNLHPEEPIGA